MAAAQAVTGWSPPVVPLGTEIVIILLGPNQQKFGVHKNLICASSKYFNSAFNDGFAEAQSGVIKLPELEPKLFDFFYRWLYSAPRLVGETLYKRAPDTDRQPDELLLTLYRLADYLLVPGMKLMALEQIRETFSSYEPTIPSHEFTYLLFEDDQLESIQLYIVKHIGYWMSKSQDRDEWVELIKMHNKLAVQIAVEFANLDTTHVDALKVVHPFKVPNLEIELGMNLAVLGVEARQNDLVPVEMPDGKVLSEFTLYRRPQKANTISQLELKFSTISST